MCGPNIMHHAVPSLALSSFRGILKEYYSISWRWWACVQECHIWTKNCACGLHQVFVWRRVEQHHFDQILCLREKDRTVFVLHELCKTINGQCLLRCGHLVNFLNRTWGKHCRWRNHGFFSPSCFDPAWWLPHEHSSSTIHKSFLFVKWRIPWLLFFWSRGSAYY